MYKGTGLMENSKYFWYKVLVKAYCIEWEEQLVENMSKERTQKAFSYLKNKFVKQIVQ